MGYYRYNIYGIILIYICINLRSIIVVVRDKQRELGVGEEEVIEKYILKVIKSQINICSKNKRGI